MKDSMQYKGYYGSAHFDDEELIFYGKIEFIRALVTYEATDAPGLRKAFEESIDDYLEMCQSQNIEPEIPLKGSLNVRLGPELHRRVALTAEQHHSTINKFIVETLAKAIPGFETWRIKERVARMRRNPQTSVTIKVVAPPSAHFKSGALLKAAAKGKSSNAKKGKK